MNKHYLIQIIEKLDLLIILCEEKNSRDKLPTELVRWFSKEEVQAYFRISSTTYYKWRKEGILVPVSTIGGDRYLLEDLVEILFSKEYRERLKSQ